MKMLVGTRVGFKKPHTSYNKKKMFSRLTSTYYTAWVNITGIYLPTNLCRSTTFGCTLKLISE